MEFKDLHLHPGLQRGIDEAHYLTCMPVQEQVLTHAFGGQDLYVQSQTGTGKTAAFLVVIFQRLLSEENLTGKKAIIMVPTRELAVQVEEEAKLLGKYLPFKIGSFYGGVGYTQQQQLLRDNVQILVGTPGRVLDLNKSGRMNLMDIAFLVLDEADRMFDMGFYPDLRKLIRVIPPADRRQTMLFSATLNAWVKNLAWEYTKSPFEIEIEPETVTVDEVEQVLYHVPSGEKMKFLLGILEKERPESALIFCNTKRSTEIVAKRLRINGIEAEFIIGDLPQSKRLKVIDDVKAGNIRFLVATDVAARGLDIEGLALVVNYDLPMEAENYVHRIGRTARAGKTGKAITLASEQDVYELPAIERYIGKKIPAQFAGGEFHADDKSEGMQIRTDFYEERREGRGRPRGDRSRGFGGVRERGDRRPGQPETRPGRERRGGRDSPDAGHDRGGGRNRTGDQSRRTLPPGGTAEGQELSHLSFEERMAYYKQKYEGTGAPRAEGAAGIHNAPRSGAADRRGRGRKRPGRSGEERQTGQGGKGGPGADQGDRPGSAKPGSRRGEASPRKERKTAQDRGGKAAEPGRGRPGGPQDQGRKGPPAEGAGTVKKGVLSRIFGLFRKDGNR
ncbi:MAG: DEAD/DEAH box helicase [Treponema sp.]|jgi:ATP-dependent RNA helicase RhlB|nr:DEAD/DEAH box helicase [Treponema sp.]